MGFAKKEIESFRMTAARPTLPEPESQSLWDGQEERKNWTPWLVSEVFQVALVPRQHPSHARYPLFSSQSILSLFIFRPVWPSTPSEMYLSKAIPFLIPFVALSRGKITEPPKLRTSTQSRCITYITIVKKRRERKKKSKKEKRVNKKSKRKSKCSMCRESK